MKVIGLILGSHGTPPDTVDPANPTFKPTLIPSSVKKRIKENILRALPDGVDFEFAEITSESQLFELPEADIYVASPFQNIHDRWFHILYSHNKPIVIMPLPLSEIFSYGDVYYPYFIRDTREIDGALHLPHKVFLSKDESDLSLILKALYVKYRINHTRALCIGEPMYEPFHSWDWGYAMVRAVQEKFGLTWIQMSSENFLKYWKTWAQEVDITEIRESARKIHFSEDEKLRQAMKMYLVLKSIIKEKEADAFTINCLASIILPKLEITPCYALSRLNDEGTVSACEADTTTLLDMLITVYASNSPGFMANPYLFPSDDRLLLSHCTSPTLHSYQEKERDEFDFYTYFDSPTKLGIAPQVLKSPETVTITGISHNLDRMLIIGGKIEANTYFSTCRTQVEIKVDEDVKQVAENYQGRHWILVYGDHKEVIKRTNEVLGIESITP
ncbi:hypothetical protein DRQ15_03075 [candidate division KSB1 bacterium]|nr:MAG: hypothetical protein DRQ15_03075 [candidate division KSB1 bacterium]